MGASISWAAFKGKPKEQVLNELGLMTTGGRGIFGEWPYSCAILPSGWFLLAHDHSEDLVSDSLLQRASVGCEVVACFVEEHVVFSHAVGWKNGEKIWEITHDSTKNILNIETKGALPTEYPAIKERLFREQENRGGKKAPVDYIFDVPVQVVETLTGFRHDNDIPGLSDEAFEEVIPTNVPQAAPSKRSFLQRIFGGS